MKELIYYSDTGIKITGEQAKLGGKSFNLSDITSVKVQTTQTDTARNLPSFLLVIGSLLMFGLTNLRAVIPAALENIAPMAVLAGMLLSMAGITILVIQMVLKTDYMYILSINGKFGGACPVASDDERYIRKLASALTTALNESREEASEVSSALVDSL